MNTSEVLRQARALIDTPDKWCQHRSSVNGRRCMIGAVDGVVVGSGRNEACYALGRAVNAYCADEPWPREWNDAPERTHAEVLAAFDTAISDAEAAEQEFSATACEPVKATA